MELVGDCEFVNVVVFNLMLFNVVWMVGLVVVGFLIVLVGIGWVFFVNGFSFFVVLVLLLWLWEDELCVNVWVDCVCSSLFDGFCYVWCCLDLMVIFVMLFLIGMFGFNF